jgi:signal transduction histidine kinase/ligand-binding sensor domain-containing protein
MDVYARQRWGSTWPYVLLWLCLFCVAGRAQYRFDHWTTDNGLPQNTVRSSVQTRDGYLWLTTFDGLVRFDGVRFTVFDKSNTPAITNNRFTALYEDKDGTLWAGADQGEVLAYRSGVFTSYSLAEGMRGASITNFRRDFNDELMVVTPPSAYYVRAGKFIAAAPEYTNPKLKLYRAESGAQWTIDARGARQFKDGQEFYYPIKFQWGEVINGMNPYEDSRGDLWLADARAVYRLRDGRMLRYTEQDGLPPGVPLRPQCEDDEGGVWFATGELLKDGIGVARFKDGRFTVYEGSIWVTTASGLYRLRKELITTYSTANGLPHNEVYPLLKTRDGQIWVGTIRGLQLFRNGAVASHPLNSFKEIVQALCEDQAGRLWIGLYGSLYRYENGKMQKLTPPQTQGAPVWAIHEDREGAIWVGTNRGLLKFEGDSPVAYFTTKEGLPSNDVKVIHESRGENGRSVLWFGTFGGLARFKDGRFTTYTTAEGLVGNRVRSIYEDSEGALWAGTYDDGLSRFRNGRFFNYRTEQGLYNNGVFQILEDRHGYFWISCNKGIYRVSRRELNELAEGRIPRVNSVAFGKQDGMLNTECNGGRQPAGLVADDGRLWFPTMGGVAVIDPEAAPVNSLPPPVMIESVRLERGPVEFSLGVTVAPGQRDLEIGYTGLNFAKPEQVKFKYKLEGLNDDWLEVGTRRVAYFPYLPPGSYRFRVIAANSDGVWNDAGAALDISVATPFYRAWWFITLLTLSWAGVALLVYQRRFAALRARQAAQEAFSRQLIESQEAERKRIAAELHDSLGQSLAIIKNRAQLGLSAPDDHDRALEQLREISEASTEVIDEVKEIAHNLRPYQLDRLGLTKTIEGMIRKVSETHELRFAVELDQLDGLFTPEGEIHLFRIVQESINNIVEHAQAKEASILIKQIGRRVTVAIRDNGKGFAAAAPSAAASSRPRGFGVVGMAERARVLGGHYEIHSTPGLGTTLKLTIDLPSDLKSGE